MKRSDWGFEAISLPATCMLTSCSNKEKVTPDLKGTVTITPNTNVFTGDELTAAYNGSETVAWQWSKNGADISGATANTFIPDGEGTYSVTATATGYNSKSGAAVEVKPVFLLEEVVRSHGWRSVLEYDGRNRISKWSDYDDTGKLAYVSTLTYNPANGNVTEVNFAHQTNPSNNYKTTFAYSANKITITQSNGTNKDIFEVDAQGYLLKRTAEYDGNENITTYTWQNGNLSKEEGDGYTRTYEYDNKKSPMHHCKNPKWFKSWWAGRADANNLIKQTYVDGGGTQIYEYEYTYDANRFPLTHKRVGGTGTTTYKYMRK